ncbi:alanine--tRNA ligase [Megamonas hypermegale]|uniref:alanine--tRNA ligase n=1 Tax=Megamonas hypermegale TaxID=158847 RepID=UPI001957F35E|nr:alanine--tRNA ligase [Megamonas hypermegale]MBM6832398.1 alanine--tRNA ligase [Megamonas hypermegale]
MKYMSGKEIRRKYLDFFVKNGHLELPSASLIPKDDPSLLMIGAGMAPFKAYFTGKMKPPCTRITTSQRCVRTGDIENVGHTARHHTFFEMLGNFSFGDYFKYDAIRWAWQFLTEELDLPKDKLWATIYPDDEEAYKIWTTETDINPDHIVKLDDNFWEIGSGPCGPDSEIFIDLGEERGCGSPTCGVGCDCDRFLEIWNLVFTQFDRTEDGKYNPLVHKNIDTGCGLERVASVLQNKPSNFETDLMFPIIEYASKVAGVEYGKNKETDVSLKVIADHARSISFMVMDGILPSNEGRGYVLRRLLRRAVRHARTLGIQQKFLAGAVDVVAEIYSGVYDELTNRKDYIKKVITLEEERFATTLNQGMELLNAEIESLKAENKTVLDGEVGFKLYDTYGFPWELTDEILHENNMTLDKDSFDKAMEQQRTRARNARGENKRMDIPDLRDSNIGELKIDENVRQAKIVCIWKNAQITDSLEDGDEAGVILDVTPFYAEGGGQEGDIGSLKSDMGSATVIDTKKLPDGTVYNIVHVTEGSLHTGDAVEITVDMTNKLASARNHTATHLLQAALKRVVGDHINQAGSFVNADHLRFDFSSFEPITDEQLAEVEAMVNAEILTGQDVNISFMKQDEAKEMGAMALFGEKYGDIVRVVTVPGFSMELCGGSHVKNVGQIGMFKIVSETGVAAGVRRIEALTGKAAIDYMNNKAKLLSEAVSTLKTNETNLLDKVNTVLTENKEMKQELTKVQAARAKADSQKLLMGLKEYNGVNVIVGKVQAATMDELRNSADLICSKYEKAGVVVLGAVIGDKVNFVVKANKDAVARGIHAGKIVKEVAQVAGGNGGGRPDMAQAGAKQAEKLPEAFDKAHQIIQAQIK